MSTTSPKRLYNLLPATYRVRDAEEGMPLAALLDILEEELVRLEEDVARLRDDWFIETCEEWLVPYIGDLLSVEGLFGATDAPFSQRAFVANVLRYRRRKGTIAVVESLARDVSGWGAHAVEFFQLLGWTQHLNHVRLSPSRTDPRDPPAVDRVGTVNVRNLDLLDRLDGPFDRLAHTVDVRRVTHTEGWHNIRNVGVFLWRLMSYPLTDAPARRSDAHPWAYHFRSPGHPAPLFTRPRTGSDHTERVTEVDVPGPIRPLAFYEDLKAYAEANADLAPEKQAATSHYYGPGRSVNVVKDGTSVPPGDIVCKDLSEWSRPPAGKVAVDVALGRLTFAEGEEPSAVTVDFSYGFSDDTGGGPYDRRESLTRDEDVEWTVDVAKGTSVNTLQKAFDAWEAAGKPRGRVRVTDNAVYGGVLQVTLPENGFLAVEAASGRRPGIRVIGNVRVAAPPEGASFTLNGFLVEGSIETEGDVDLTIRHATIVPGRTLSDEGEPESPDRDAIVTSGPPASGLTVTVERSIVGPIRLPEEAEKLVVRDAIVDAPPVGDAARPAIAADDAGTQPAPPTTLERATIFGGVRVRELTLASEVIFNAPVVVHRRQVGCVRLSYVPPGSRTPRRYRCQPELALADRARHLELDSPFDLPAAERALVLSRLKPRFTSRRYKDPAYAQLGSTCAEEIRTGAEDGSEMGAFSRLKQPQREDQVRWRAAEYLPFGMEAGTVHVT